MNTTDFIKLVAQMRNTQKLYFSTRAKTALAEAKRIEMQVDNMLANYEKKTPSNKWVQLTIEDATEEEEEICECSNDECQWIGNNVGKREKQINEYLTELVCPNCGNDEFYHIPTTTTP